MNTSRIAMNEYIGAKRRAYEASRPDRHRLILDDVCEMTGYSRKDRVGTSMYCVNGESEKTLHGCDFKRKHLYRGCILPRVEVRGNLIFSNESRAMPRCCRQFWRTQSDERIACIPASACKNPLAVCSSLRQVAVNKFSLRVCELVASSKSKFVHAFCSDGLME